MTELFFRLVNMSISAGWLVLAVLALRLILKKAPKWVNVLLWALVAIRLISPFSIESRLSLIPYFELTMQDIVADSQTASKGQILDSQGNVLVEKDLFGVSQSKGQILDSDGRILLEKPLNQVSDSADTSMQNLIHNLSLIWFVGMILMLGYTLFSYLYLKRKVSTSIPVRKGIRQSEYINSPFVLGLFRPVVYLPYGMNQGDIVHVIAHEQAHIRRKDHWWKPLGFLLLTVYWFNPLMWVAYILLCRDIELACDEKVIAGLGNEQRADYTQALVACAVNRRMIAACPLAFGEVGVKDRVKSIMNYRKPTFWIIVTAVVVCVVVAVCFLTDPNPSREFSMNGNSVSGLDPEAIVARIMDIEDINNRNVYMNSMNFSLQVDSNFNWTDSQTVRYFYWKDHKTQSGQLRIFPDEDKYFLTEPSEWHEQEEIFLLHHYLEAVKYLPQYEIQQMAPADQYIIQHVAEGRPSDYERVITYSSDGVQETTGWFIHLQIQPLHADGEAYSGTGDEVIELFYGDRNGKFSDYAKMWFDFTVAPEQMEWTEEMKCTIAEFPGITFKSTPYEIVATTSWEHSDTAGKTILISGMPIWNAYFSDLTGDGLPEICAQLSYGSGMIDNRVIIFDYANGVSYKLEDRGSHDYYLRMNDADGYLYVDKRVYNSDLLVSSGRLVCKDGCIQIEDAHSEPLEIPDPEVSFEGNLNLGLNAEIVDIDYDQKILYVKDINEKAEVFGDRCAVDCTYAISRYNLMYVTYGDPNDIRTIDFSVFEVGDAVIIGMYDSEKQKALNGNAVADQVQLSTQRLSSLTANESLSYHVIRLTIPAGTDNIIFASEKDYFKDGRVSITADYESDSVLSVVFREESAPGNLPNNQPYSYILIPDDSTGTVELEGEKWYEIGIQLANKSELDIEVIITLHDESWKQ